MTVVLAAGFLPIIALWSLVAWIHGQGLTPYWTAAIAMSAFYGLGSTSVWRQPIPVDKDTPWLPWFVHQVWINGLGSAVGWGAAFWFYQRMTANTWKVEPLDVGLAFVAFIGVTGWLPAAVTGFATALGTLARKAVEAVAGKW
jgi:hypothetical protein